MHTTIESDPDVEQHRALVVAVHAARKAEAAVCARDAAICRAVGHGVPPWKIAEATGLPEHRVMRILERS